MHRCKLVPCFFAIVLSWPAAAVIGAKNCNEILIGGPLPKITSETQALSILSESLIEVFGRDRLQNEHWFQLLNHFALPQINNVTPLVVTSIIGGGNAGKSTLMNAMPSLIMRQRALTNSQYVSQTGWFAGMTQRMLIAAPSDATGVVDSDLRERFGELTNWQTPSDVLRPGPGVLVRQADFPPNIAFIDAPDFDTGPALSAQPENLERALRVICPSDALMAIFSLQTYRSQPTIHRLIDVFKSYGQKKMILVLLGDSSIRRDEAYQILKSVSESIFGDSANEGVLGTYLMPHQSEVAQGIAHPTLVPLGKSPEFDQLVLQMNAHSMEIKAYSLRSAVETITKEANALVRSEIKSRVTAELYSAALKSLTREVAKTSVEDFPYHAFRSQIRERFIRYTSRLNKVLKRLNEVVATPEKEVVSILRHIARRDGDPEFQRQLEQDHQWHDRVAVTQFMLALDKGGVALESRDAELNALGLKYERIFPEEKVLVESNGKTAVKLPSEEFLPPAARAAFHEIKSSDERKLTRELSGELNRAQMEGSADPQIDRTLQRIYTNRTWLQSSVTTGLQMLTLAVPACTGYVLASHGFSDTLLYLAVCNLSARPVNVLNNYSTDQYLLSHLNRWFHLLQENTTARFLNEKVTAGLRSELEKPEPEKIRALRSIQASLQYLNRDYKPVTLTLRQ